MTGPQHTFEENSGFVHTGSGDINNYIYRLTDSKGRTPREVGYDYLQWLWQRFVHPEGFDKARKILKTNRTVFLKIPAGGGKRTATQMLLFSLDTGSDRIRELPVPGPEQKEDPIDLTNVGKGDRVWIDLSDLTTPQWSRLRLELPGLRKAAHVNAASLSVILPDHGEDLHPALIPYRVNLTPPSAQEVFKQYLWAENFNSTVLSSLPELPTGAQTLGKVSEFVNLILEARDSASGDGDFQTWFSCAEEALPGWREEASKLLNEMEGGPQRALLWSASMLPGISAEKVHRASAVLLRLTEHPHEEKPILERLPLDAQFQKLGLDLDARHHVNFNRLDYDSAIRMSFWTYLPELREPLTFWIEHVAGDEDLDDEERESLVRNFIQLCETHRHQPRLKYLIEQWTMPSSTSRETKAAKMRAAEMLLLNGLRNDTQSRFFRKQIYDWSRQTDPQPQLAELLVAACRSQMALAHPDQAVIRLHHLARREQGSRAKEALVDLVTQDHQQLRHLLQRISRSSNNAQPPPTDAFLFLDLTDPAALAKAGVLDLSDHLGAGWRLLFSLMPHEAWMRRAWQWLEYAVVCDEHRDALIDALIQGAARDFVALSYLHWMTERRDLQPVLHGRFIRRLNQARESVCTGPGETP